MYLSFESDEGNKTAIEETCTGFYALHCQLHKMRGNLYGLLWLTLSVTWSVVFSLIPL